MSARRAHCCVIAEDFRRSADPRRRLRSARFPLRVVPRSRPATRYRSALRSTAGTRLATRQRLREHALEGAAPAVARRLSAFVQRVAPPGRRSRLLRLAARVEAGGGLQRDVRRRAPPCQMRMGADGLAVALIPRRVERLHDAPRGTRRPGHPGRFAKGKLRRDCRSRRYTSSGHAPCAPAQFGEPSRCARVARNREFREQRRTAGVSSRSRPRRIPVHPRGARELRPAIHSGRARGETKLSIMAG